MLLFKSFMELFTCTNKFFWNRANLLNSHACVILKGVPLFEMHPAGNKCRSWKSCQNIVLMQYHILLKWLLPSFNSVFQIRTCNLLIALSYTLYVFSLFYSRQLIVFNCSICFESVTLPLKSYKQHIAAVHCFISSIFSCALVLARY